MPPPRAIERRSNTLPLSQQARLCQTRLFFGGSFDPPHLGHAALPPIALNRIASGDSARLIYVPAARSPHKDHAPADDGHRVRMLELALAQTPDWEIWRQELTDAQLNPGAPSYWADTWEIVRRMGLPGTSRFLIGADQALSMHRWRRYQEFWPDAAVMLRDELSEDALIDQLAALGGWSEAHLARWRTLIVRVPTLDASSTAIRDALAEAARRENPIAGLDDRVHSYILDHGLYAPRS